GLGRDAPGADGERANRPGDLRHVVRSRRAETVRARRRAAALLLVHRGGEGVHRGHAGRSRLRDRLLGPRHESVDPGLGAAAASRYAQFAPSVPHALHMPSHTYVLLGMWTETIQSNVAAAAAEKDRGNPDDRMHALDYLVYGYLQQAQDGEAKKIVDEARGIMTELAARNYNSGRATAAVAIAAIEARWTMERGRWAEAAAIEPRPTRFPQTDAMIHFARAIGAARTGNAAQARAETEKLGNLRETLQQNKDAYWAEQVEIQRRAAAAWTARAEGKTDDALALMRSAAELEATTEKHNISPGPIVLARELLGDMLLEMQQPAKAIA